MIKVENEINLVSLALNFADKHKSKYTGFIHYKNQKEQTRDVVGFVENVFYGICLVKSLSKEKAEHGFYFLERIFAFFTKDGFPLSLHDFPNVYSDRANVDIFLALSFFLKDYAQIIPKKHLEKIDNIHERLGVILKQRLLKGLDLYVYETALFKHPKAAIECSSLLDFERIFLCDLLLGKKVTIPWHEKLGVYIGPLKETYYNKYECLDSLFSLLVFGKKEAKIALYGALLPKIWLERSNCFSTSRKRRFFCES